MQRIHKRFLNCSLSLDLITVVLLYSHWKCYISPCQKRTNHVNVLHDKFVPIIYNIFNIGFIMTIFTCSLECFKFLSLFFPCNTLLIYILGNIVTPAPSLPCSCFLRACMLLIFLWKLYYSGMRMGGSKVQPLASPIFFFFNWKWCFFLIPKFG